ncbi:MAG: hypothetical protein M3Y03_02690, partial [Verrucomicrobiota bacterium]|nr:hypothetical protein [Verrucomicrobiota bacterium]
MRAPATLIFALLAGTLAHAQNPVAPSLSGQPVEITSSGGTTYNGGVAISRENVAVHAGDADIYADEAEYDSNTHDVRLRGHVRIYRGFEFYLGTRGTYNTETKKITADDLRSVDKPFFVHGEKVATMDDGGQRVEKGSLTLDDSDSPDFQIRASSIRFYEGDRVILKHATLYVGRVPIFYWPYLYQSLDDSFSFLISPAYTSTWGASLLTQARFAFTENIRATFRLDLRARRCAALGFAPYITYGKNKTSYAKIRTYFARDDDPTINRTALPRGAVPTGRYRLSLEVISTGCPLRDGATGF